MNNWKKYKLGDLVTFQRGHDLPKTQFIEGKYPIWGSNGIIGYHYEFTTKGNGIVIGRSGNIGKPQFCKEDFWAHNTTLYVKEFHNSNPKFIFYLLQTMNLANYNSGSAVPTLNRNYIHPIEVEAPNLETQTRIANFLSQFDDKIELNRQMNKNLEELAQLKFKTLLKDKDKWRKGKLGEFFEIIMGQSPKGESYNENKEGIIFYQGRSDFGVRFPTERIYTTEPTRFAEKFDTLISVRAPVGDLNIALERCCLGRGLGAIRSKYFSFAFYTAKSLVSEIKSFQSGTVFDAINKKDLENINMIIPPIEEIEEFEKFANPIDLKIYNNEIQSRTLATYRDSILPKLMSGAIEI